MTWQLMVHFKMGSLHYVLEHWWDSDDTQWLLQTLKLHLHKWSINDRKRTESGIFLFLFLEVFKEDILVCGWIRRGQDVKVILLWLLLDDQISISSVLPVLLSQTGSGDVMWKEMLVPVCQHDDSYEIGVLQNVKLYYQNHPDLWGFNTNASVCQQDQAYNLCCLLTKFLLKSSLWKSTESQQQKTILFHFVFFLFFFKAAFTVINQSVLWGVEAEHTVC